MRKKKTKAILNANARRQALERHDLVLDKDLRRRIIADIQEMPVGGSDLVKFVLRLTLNRSLWEVTLPDKKFRVFYDRRRNTLSHVLSSACKLSRIQPAETEQANG